MIGNAHCYHSLLKKQVETRVEEQVLNQTKALVWDSVWSQWDQDLNLVIWQIRDQILGSPPRR